MAGDQIRWGRRADNTTARVEGPDWCGCNRGSGVHRAIFFTRPFTPSGTTGSRFCVAKISLCSPDQYCQDSLCIWEATICSENNPDRPVEASYRMTRGHAEAYGGLGKWNFSMYAGVW